MIASKTIDELRNRFNSEKARDVNATYLITIKGDNGGSWLAKIADGKLDLTPQDSAPAQTPDCAISVDADDLEMILDGRMSAMTAALSGVLAIDGELGLAMQLVPIFFEG